MPLLQTGSAEISDVIENQQVVQLPLNGRNFLSLAQLSDAVVIPPGGTRGDSLQQAGPLPNVGGQRSGHNIYLLDGVKVTDELFNNLVINPSVDSIQEFKIQKSQYPAEFGGKASALINVATRAGANSLRGSLFEFFRHDQFDAHNYFDPKDQPVPPLRQNQFGGAFGGPVVRDRSFFFFSYEGQRVRRSLTRTFSVPTAAVRGGDFSGSGTICDPLTIATERYLRAVREQPHPDRATRSAGGDIPRSGAAPNVERGAPEPDVDRAAGQGHGPVQPASRSSLRLWRSGLRAREHLRCGRSATVRQQQPSGNARARLWTHAQYQGQKRRRQPHPHLEPVPE